MIIKRKKTPRSYRFRQKLTLPCVATLCLCIGIPGSSVAKPRDRLATVAVSDAVSGISKGSLKVELHREVGTSTIKITAPLKITAKAFQLRSPQRLVCDLGGLKAATSSRFEVRGDPYVSTVRIGSHTDKVRLVIDLSEDTPLPFNFHASGRQVILTLGAVTPTPIPVPATTPKQTPATSPTVGLTAAPTVALTIPTSAPLTVAPTSATTTAVVVTATATPQQTLSATPTADLTAAPTIALTVAPTAAPLNSPTATATIAPTATRTQTPTRTPAATPTVRRTPVPPTPTPKTTTANTSAPSVVLLGFRFEYLEPGKIPILKINLNRARAYAKIGRVGPRDYKIIIPAGSLASKGLELPQFPPADFLGFVMVSAKVMGDKLEITINVEQDVKLGTFVRNNEIWVKRLQ